MSLLLLLFLAMSVIYYYYVINISAPCVPVIIIMGAFFGDVPVGVELVVVAPAHVVHEFLDALLVVLDDAVDEHRVHVLVDLHALVDFDLLLVDVLLHSPLVVIPTVEIVCLSQSLVLFFLLLYIVFSLLHAHKQFFEFFFLFVLLAEFLPAEDVLADAVLGGDVLLDLEVDDGAADLDGLGDGLREFEAVAHEHERAELAHVVLQVEAVAFELDECVAATHTDVVDPQIRVVAAPQAELPQVEGRRQHVHHPRRVLLQRERLQNQVVAVLRLVHVDQRVLLVVRLEHVRVRRLADLALELLEVV